MLPMLNQKVSVANTQDSARRSFETTSDIMTNTLPYSRLSCESQETLVALTDTFKKMSDPVDGKSRMSTSSSLFGYLCKSDHMEKSQTKTKTKMIAKPPKEHRLQNNLTGFGPVFEASYWLADPFSPSYDAELKKKKQDKKDKKVSLSSNPPSPPLTLLKIKIFGKR